MSTGASILLIVVGAILRYAITANPDGVDLDALGLILMIAGLVGLAVSLLYVLITNANARREADLERYERQQMQQRAGQYQQPSGEDPGQAGEGPPPR